MGFVLYFLFLHTLSTFPLGPAGKALSFPSESHPWGESFAVARGSRSTTHIDTGLHSVVSLPPTQHNKKQ